MKMDQGVTLAVCLTAVFVNTVFTGRREQCKDSDGVKCKDLETCFIKWSPCGDSCRKNLIKDCQDPASVQCKDLKSRYCFNVWNQCLDTCVNINTSRTDVANRTGVANRTDVASRTDWKPHGIKEAIWIRTTPSAISRDESRYKFPYTECDHRIACNELQQLCDDIDKVKTECKKTCNTAACQGVTTTQSTEHTTLGHLAQYSGHDAVAGGVTGGVIFLIALAIVVVLVLWRKRKLSRIITCLKSPGRTMESAGKTKALTNAGYNTGYEEIDIGSGEYSHSNFPDSGDYNMLGHIQTNTLESSNVYNKLGAEGLSVNTLDTGQYNTIGDAQANINAETTSRADEYDTVKIELTEQDFQSSAHEYFVLEPETEGDIVD